MKQLLNPLVKDIQISGIRQFFNMISQYDDLIQLTIGQPDFPTPHATKQSGINAIENNFTSYTPNAGLMPLRKAISKWIKNNYQLDYHWEDEIIVTVGASQGLDIAFRTILNPGDEVILPAPIYPGYEPLIRLAGAHPIYIDTRQTNFKLTAEALEKNITPKTKCVVLPYPSNPIGITLLENELDSIKEVLLNKDIFILSDEIYSELVYDTTHVSIAMDKRFKDKTIVINGLSKSHAMTGWRIGFTLAPAYITEQMLKVHQYNVSCASSISQQAAIVALTEDCEEPKKMVQEYKKRQAYVYTRLEKMGFPIVVPSGAFYLFIDISSFGYTSYDFALKLVKEAKVALVPGTAFSQYGEGFVRLSYAYDIETLTEACNRIEIWLQKINNN